jgi:hypothetical protein
MASIFIEEYSPKSFVVRGDTREHKESLKGLGGKWNTSLTDKQSGEKFGAWLFWNEKHQEIKNWIAKGCKKVEPEITTTETPNKLEAKVDYLIKMMEALCKNQGIDLSGNSNRVVQSRTLEFDSDEDVVIPVKPVKRLLGR